MSDAQERTVIYRTSGGRVDSQPEEAAPEEAVGYVEGEVIYRLKWGEGRAVGRVDANGNIFRSIAHGERELGSVDGDGTVSSAGLLFGGGEVGWVSEDGTVVQAGLIMGEEEIGRVDGPNPRAAGAALLLLFRPDEREAEHRLGQE